MALSTKQAFLSKTKNNLFLQSLQILLASGLAAQIGLVFWPIENYATIVYLLFYLPFLIIIFIHPKDIFQILLNTDKFLLASLAFLLSWVAISSFWSTDVPEKPEIILDTFKHCVLIFLYVLGIAYLVIYNRKIVYFSLMLAVVFAGFICSVTLFNQLIINDLPLKARLVTIGIYDWKSSSNPVVLGIYFGVMSVIVAAIIIKPFFHYTLVRVFLLAILASVLATTFITRTRTALIALIICTAIFLIIEKKRYLAATMLTATSIAIISGIMFDLTEIKSFVLRGGLGSWRPQIWVTSILQSIEHFWFGLGMGSETLFSVERDSIISTQTHSHNFYLQLLTWSGFFGLAGYCILIFRSTKLALKEKHLPLGAISLISINYFMVAQTFDVYNIFTSPSYYWPCIWLPIGILLGLSATHSDPENDRKICK